MNPVQTYDPYDGRMIAREERIGGYVLLSDYQKLEKRVRELEDQQNVKMVGVAGFTIPADLGERVLKAEQEMRGFVPPGGPVEATD